MQSEMNQLLPDPSLTLDPVINRLEEALRLFAQGDSKQACLRLAEANSLLGSCLDDVKRKPMANSTASRPVELEKPALIA
jgi:hypothetical protein